MEDTKWCYINKTTGEKVRAEKNPDMNIFIDEADAKWYENLGTPNCRDISAELQCSHQCNNCGSETNDPEHDNCDCGGNYWVKI